MNLKSCAYVGILLLLIATAMAYYGGTVYKPFNENSSAEFGSYRYGTSPPAGEHDGSFFLEGYGAGNEFDTNYSTYAQCDNCLGGVYIHETYKFPHTEEPFYLTFKGDGAKYLSEDCTFNISFYNFSQGYKEVYRISSNIIKYYNILVDENLKYYDGENDTFKVRMYGFYCVGFCASRFFETALTRPCDIDWQCNHYLCLNDTNVCTDVSDANDCGGEDYAGNYSEFDEFCGAVTGYQETYRVSDLPLITGDIIGTAGAEFRTLIPLYIFLMILLLLIYLYIKARKSW